jgi:hypothetical protein
MSVERVIRLHEVEQKFGIAFDGNAKLWIISHVDRENIQLRKNCAIPVRGRAALQRRDRAL